LEQYGNVADPDNPPYNPVIVNCVAWFSITFVLLAGMSWYFRENWRQQARLIILEEQENAQAAGVPTYSSPDGPHTSEMEMV
jgi:hypothetical protein